MWKKHGEGPGCLAEPILWFPSRYLVILCPTFLALLFVTPIETVRLPVTDPGQGNARAVLLALECGSANCEDTEAGQLGGSQRHQAGTLHHLETMHGIASYDHKSLSQLLYP